MLNRVEKSLPLILMQSKNWLAFPTRKHIWLVLDLTIKMPASPSLHQTNFSEKAESCTIWSAHCSEQAKVEWVVSTIPKHVLWIWTQAPQKKEIPVFSCVPWKNLSRNFLSCFHYRFSVFIALNAFMQGERQRSIIIMFQKDSKVLFHLHYWEIESTLLYINSVSESFSSNHICYLTKLDLLRGIC